MSQGSLVTGLWEDVRFWFFLHLPERRDILLNIFIFREKVSGTNNNWIPSFAALAQQFKKQTNPILVQ